MQTGPTSQISIFGKKFHDGLTWPIFIRFGLNFVQKSLVSLWTDSECLKCLKCIFRPTSPTNQNRPIAKIINFCVFRPIWMKFGMGANMGLQTTWKEFERPTTFTWPTSPTNQNRPIAKIFNFCVFVPIWMKFGTGVNNRQWTTLIEFETAIAIF